MISFRLILNRVLIVMTGVACLAFASNAQDVTDQDVADYITLLQKRLIGRQKADGSWPHSYPVGMTALAVQALIRSGYPVQSKELQAAIAYVNNNSDQKTYSEGLAAGAMLEADPVKYRKRIEEALDFLVDAQTVSGQWTYQQSRGGAGGDNSNVQFAILGLAAAEEAGFEIPGRTRSAAIDHWLRTQNQNGGWGYNGPGGPTIQMTCAGVASLTMLGEQLRKKDLCCGEPTMHDALLRGLNFISDKMQQGVDRALPNGGHAMYALYALERVAIYLGLKEIGGQDWYRWGANAIVRGNMGQGKDPDVALALLFLAKGSTPIAIAKAKWNGDWNNQEDDVKNWVKIAGMNLRKELDYIHADMEALDSPAAKASLLFINGREQFNATNEEIGFMRSFLEQGGTIVAEASCNSVDFYDSFRKAMLTRLCSESAKFVPLTDDHPVCTIRHKLEAQDVSALEFKAGCKQYRLYLLTRPISCALDGARDSLADLPRASKVATNFLTFAMQSKEARHKLDKTELTFVRDDGNALTADQIRLRQAETGRTYAQPIARLRHSGQWLAAPHFLNLLLKSLNTNPMLVQFDKELYVRPLDQDLYESATAFITGYEFFRYQEAEIISLRQYLQNGGFLLATATCSNEEFDQGFRKLMTELFPNDTLEPIPPEDPLWYSFIDLRGKKPEGTAEYHRLHQNKWAPLFGIKRDGRWIVIYSPTDFSSDLSGGINNNISAYLRQSALELCVNILHQSFTP